MTVHLDRIAIARDGHGDEVSTPHRNGAVAAKRKPPKKMPEGRRLLMDMITQAINEAGHELRSLPMGRWCAPSKMKRCALAEEERGR